jgi:hypothetical protein
MSQRDGSGGNLVMAFGNWVPWVFANQSFHRRRIRRHSEDYHSGKSV